MTTMDDTVAVRLSILDALYRAGGGHYGGALSVVEVLLALHAEMGGGATNVDRENVVLLSKGHAAIALYAVLKHVGILEDVDLGEYGQFGRGLEGHPCMLETKGVSFSSGSLGQGLSVGLGLALARPDSHVWVVMGDGECQEGQPWEAAQLAARYAAANLHAIVDNNGAQEVGWTHDKALPQPPMPDLESKWRAFGWFSSTTDGHSHDSLRRWIRYARTAARPTALVAVTTKGKGVPSIEKTPGRFHCTSLTKVEHDAITNELLANARGANS